MEMQAYLEKVLHREVRLTAYDDIAKLPLIYRSTVRLHVLNIDKQACLLIEPLETMALPDLRKCCKQTERLRDALCFVSAYAQLLCQRKPAEGRYRFYVGKSSTVFAFHGCAAEFLR